MKIIARLIASNSFLWRAYNYTAGKFATNARKYRKVFLHRLLVHNLGPDYVVREGLFSGMRYSSPHSHGSTFLPKILGTYELEIASIINGWKDLNFPIIIDIGCAEGYYAVGLARVFPESLVYAFDIAEEARAMCREMIDANEVGGRVQLEGECQKKHLQSIDLKFGGLVVSDCEGFEAALFDETIAEHMNRCHAIIEIHDHPEDKNVRMRQLVAAFSKTHTLRIVNSVDDIQKVHFYKSDCVSQYDPIEREVAFGEGRPWIMHWLVAEPRQTAQSLHSKCIGG